MAHWEELRHLFTEFFGGGEIFPPLSWRTSGFRAHTKLTRGSPPALPPCPEPCGLSAPAGSGPVRRGSTAGLCPQQRPGSPSTSGRDPPAAQPRRRPREPPDSCQEIPPSATPAPKGSKAPPQGSTPRPHPAGTSAPEENREGSPHSPPPPPPAAPSTPAAAPGSRQPGSSCSAAAPCRPLRSSGAGPAARA